MRQIQTMHDFGSTVLACTPSYALFLAEAIHESEIKPHYLLIVDRVNNLDTLELKVEVDEAFFQDKISQLEALRQKLQINLENSLGLGIKVTLVEPKILERSEGKSKRVIDNRKF
jgi:phenylacetate-CoA ligase